jgi:hypothetical protein
MTDLLLTTAPADIQAALRDQARRLFESLVQVADREALQMHCRLAASRAMKRWGGAVSSSPLVR